MQFFTDNNVQFPLVELSLNQGETVYIQRGSMVYHTPNVTLNTKLKREWLWCGTICEKQLDGQWFLVKAPLLPRYLPSLIMLT